MARETDLVLKAKEAFHWRLMQESDLDDIARVANSIHTAYPEDPAVFANRFHLYPAGCSVLDDKGRVAGYAITHPWKRCHPSRLNSLLDALPVPADTYYIHDIALMPEARGRGLAQEAAEAVAHHAVQMGFETLTLISVAGARDFWQRQGFRCCDTPDAAGLVESYGEGIDYMMKNLA